MKLSQYDPELYGIMSKITGSELLFLLKKIGITQKRYGLQLDPPLSTASAVNNYSTHKQLPFRLIAPLLDSYPADFLLHLLEEYPKRRNH
ncbi:MAG: hypothetical protein ACOYND_09915 [Bacteroidota bacterium]